MINEELKILKIKYQRLLNQLNSLVRENDEYKEFFRKDDGIKAHQEADLRYYCYLMDLMQVGPYDEGRFSLEYESLDSRMNTNKQERKEIEIRIKQIKLQIKNIQK